MGSDTAAWEPYSVVPVLQVRTQSNTMVIDIQEM